MTRTQISLTEEQHLFLERLARQTGESMSSLIRKAVDRMRAEQGTPDHEALRLIGAFTADRDDISRRHDDFLWDHERPAGKRRQA